MKLNALVQFSGDDGGGFFRRVMLSQASICAVVHNGLVYALAFVSEAHLPVWDAQNHLTRFH
jgi:hypothetical protein